MAKGLLPDDHPQSAAAARSYVIGNADVVLVAGARLNWLLSHGRAPLWNRNALDPGRYLADRDRQQPRDRRAGDRRHQFGVRSVQRRAETGPVKRQAAWMDEIGERKKQNVERMAASLSADPNPMTFSTAAACGARCAPRPIRMSISSTKARIRSISGATSSTCTCRAGDSTRDLGRDGHRHGYAIGAAAVTGNPVVAIEGDSAFGFSGMEIETICRYRLPVRSSGSTMAAFTAATRKAPADPPTVLVSRRAIRQTHRSVRRYGLSRAPTRPAGPRR